MTAESECRGESVAGQPEEARCRSEGAAGQEEAVNRHRQEHWPNWLQGKGSCCNRPTAGYHTWWGTVGHQTAGCSRAVDRGAVGGMTVAAGQRLGPARRGSRASAPSSVASGVPSPLACGQTHAHANRGLTLQPGPLHLKGLGRRRANPGGTGCTAAEGHTTSLRATPGLEPRARGSGIAAG